MEEEGGSEFEDCQEQEGELLLSSSSDEDGEEEKEVGRLSLPAGALPPATTMAMAPHLPPMHTGDKKVDSVTSLLASALDLAKVATAKDEQQEPPEKVLPYYEQAIHAMDAALKQLPENVAERTGLTQRREAYKVRVQQLKTAVARHTSTAKARHVRSQSRVPFVEKPTMRSEELEPTPALDARRPYWLMRLIRQTIKEGGYLTPNLFVPRGVWAQVGVKFSGFQARVQAMETLLYLTIDKIAVLSKPESAEGRSAGLEALQDFRHITLRMQSDLARPFPFIAEVNSGLAAAARSSLADSSPSSMKRTNLGKLNHIVKSIGRNVKNTAATAYERIGASVPNRLMDDELVYYSQLISEVCSKCQVFDDLLVAVHQADSKGSKDAANRQELIIELGHISFFMRAVICEIVLRDVETLVERYLKKMRKSFARMDWVIVD
jgi:hypothetical protein